MLIYARRAASYVAGMEFAAFRADLKTQDAVAHALQIIGEAAWKVSDETKLRHTDIEWEKIAGLRHRLVHEYGAIRLDTVWTVVEVHVPELIRLVEPLVPKPAA